jgi:hypothetical protein
VAFLEAREKFISLRQTPLVSVFGEAFVVFGGLLIVSLSFLATGH